MAVPFSNTKIRVPQGFRNLLEGFTREVLRNQPDDIIIFGARYFQFLLNARNVSNNADPCRLGADHEDRFYNAKMWQNDDMGVMCSQKYNQAAQLIQKDYKVLISNRLIMNMTKETAAIKIQKVWRGYRDRKLLKQKKKALEQPENINEINDVLNEEEEKKLSEAAMKITAAFVGAAERSSKKESLTSGKTLLLSRIERD